MEAIEGHTEKIYMTLNNKNIEPNRNNKTIEDHRKIKVQIAISDLQNLTRKYKKHMIIKTVIVIGETTSIMSIMGSIKYRWMLSVKTHYKATNSNHQEDNKTGTKQGIRINNKEKINKEANKNNIKLNKHTIP